MPSQSNSDDTSEHELTIISDSTGHTEESPLTFSENTVGYEATRASEGSGESSVASASFNFINTIVGAGVIGIPFSIYQCGFFAGITLLVAFGAATDYSVRLLIDLGLRHRVRSYSDLCEKAFGVRGFYLATFLLIAISFGAELAYLTIIGDTIPTVFMQWGAQGLLTNRKFVTFMSSLLIMLPLSALKDLSSLDRTSLLSIIAVIVIVLLILFRAPQVADSSTFVIDKTLRWTVVTPRFFQGIGAIAFAYVCQHSSFLVFASLSNPTPARWSKVTHISVGFAAAVCVVIGVAGYLPFANGVCPDVLNSFPRDDPATSGARFLLAVTMFLTYPMEFFVTRFAIISAVQRRWTHIRHKDNVPHYSVTAVLWTVTTLLGTFSTDLGIILDVTGSVAAVFLAFILPGWLCIKLDSLRFFSRAALKQGILIVVGSFFMIVSSLLILLRELKVVTANTPNHCKFE